MEEGGKVDTLIRKATSGRPLGTERFIKTLAHGLLPKKAGRTKKKKETWRKYGKRPSNFYT
jgi:hypothetical protein